MHAALNSLIFVLTDGFPVRDVSIDFSLLNADHVNAIRLLMSLSMLTTYEPRYLNSSTISIVLPSIWRFGGGV